MVDTPPKGEEPKPGETEPGTSLENKDKPKATPAKETPEAEDVDKLKADLKDARKQAMRASQLENENTELKKKDDERQRKELEDKEEWKTVAEQEKAKREELEATLDENNRKRELNKAAKAVLDDYPEEVRELAKDTGLVLTEISDEATAAFKGKLDKMNEKVANSTVTPNNPNPPKGGKEHTREELYEILRDPVKRDAYYREKYPTTAEMMDPPKT